MPPTRRDRATGSTEATGEATDTSDPTAAADGEAADGGATDPVDPALADIAGLSYEQARDELTAIVARLEGGQAPLEESMALWRRGEALAARAAAWLDAAQAEVSGPDATR